MASKSTRRPDRPVWVSWSWRLEGDEPFGLQEKGESGLMIEELQEEPHCLKALRPIPLIRPANRLKRRERLFAERLTKQEETLQTLEE